MGIYLFPCFLSLSLSLLPPPPPFNTQHDTHNTHTALGPVQLLVSTVTTDSITISWSPPTAPTDAVLQYKVTYQQVDLPSSNIITVDTMSPFVTITAAKGDVYTFSVEAHSVFGPGDSATITAAIDCESETLSCVVCVNIFVIVKDIQQA